MALKDFKDTNQGGGVLTVSNSNIGKGIKWNDTTKKYEVDVLVSTEGNVAVLTGEIAHRGTIPLPAGFTQEQCKWAVMPRLIYDQAGNGSDIDSFQVYAEANRSVVVLTENGVQNNNRATYIIIGVR